MRNLKSITLISTGHWLAANLPLVILVGLTLNGLAVTVAGAFKDADGPSLLLGLSPFQLATVLAAVALIARGAQHLPRSAWAETCAVYWPLCRAARSPGALSRYTRPISRSARATCSASALCYSPDWRQPAYGPPLP